MREYKFRIYSFISKSFIYFDIYDYPQGIAGGVSEPQQYTGLNDKNNKPIYEGDIVKIDYDTFGNVIGQVLYEADRGGYIFQYKRNGLNQNYINLNCDVAFQSVIIGNIFEIAELLK